MYNSYRIVREYGRPAYGPREVTMMKIPTKARYGVRVMVDIALHRDSGAPVLLRDIAARQKLSERYLEHVITALRNAGLVKSVRGAKGGYYLGREASAITLYDIVEATIGRLDLVDCVTAPEECERAERCATKGVWGELSGEFQRVLRSKTLEALAQEERTLADECGDPMYYI
ncbi:MAG: RrF2 family transcriptional regulator [Candidatus Geothermincolia bacterium]